MRMRSRWSWSLFILSSLATPAAAAFVNFESQHVHPIAISPDGTRVVAVNTPDTRLAVFDVTGTGLALAFEVPVGVEPVSAAFESNDRVWVANHVSDTVSIVDLGTRNVVATLPVGDEPADIVFAGGVTRRAFVSVSQEDAIKIYTPGDLSAPPVVVPIFGSDPQALAVSPDGHTVYAAIFESGNQTSIASETDVVNHGGLPAPNPPGRPNTSVVLRRDGSDWVDPAGTLYTNTHPYTLPDHDVAVLDATATVPEPTYFDHLGTLLFNIGVHPGTGKVYVPNTEALNHIRFEPNQRGKFLRTRIDIVDPASPGSPTIVDLNPHIDYAVTPGPGSEILLSLSQPGGMAFSADGSRIYMTALGSAKLAVLDAQGSVLDRIAVAEGPGGLALDELHHKLYVISRFENTISVVDTDTRQVVSTLVLFDPSPSAIRNGRRYLYDGRISSGHGDLACASCHAGGNFDGIAWDLGDPNGAQQPPPPGQQDPLLQGFHPMKGPMTTQSLRGLAATQPFHWRGDRADFENFNPAFVSLMGRSTPLSTNDMTAFKNFILTVQYAPNPAQNLDRTFPNPASGPSPERGRQIFLRPNMDGPFRCADCHALNTGTSGQIIDHFALQESQDMKVPQLRNMYEKTGFAAGPGPRKRGFGFTHDGASPTLFDFLHFPGFNFNNDAERSDVEAFLLTFDTGMAPAVGTQLTVMAANKSAAATTTWVQTMIDQADAGNCDLVVKGRRGGFPRGWVYDGNGWFRSDYTDEPRIATADLLTLADTGAELTFTGVPQGSGTRIGIDRDEDGFPDQTEIAAGSNPADPGSTPDVTAAGPGSGSGALGPQSLASWPNPASADGATIAFQMGERSRARVRIYDAGGRYITTLLSGEAGPGPVQVHWDGKDQRGGRAASGMYFYRVEAHGRVRTNSLLLVR
jgi:YVTN family beta-propeller protein